MTTSLDPSPYTALDASRPTRVALRILLLAVVCTVAGWVLWQGFFFIRDSTAPRLLTAGMAVVWAGGSLTLFFFAATRLIDQLPLAWAMRLQPFVFIGPAIALVIYYLALPTVRTFIASFLNRDGSAFVGFLARAR